MRPRKTYALRMTTRPLPAWLRGVLWAAVAALGAGAVLAAMTAIGWFGPLLARALARALGW